MCGRVHTQTMQIGHVQSCIGTIANIPVNMSAIPNIGAITLFIGYDTSMVDSVFLSNINPLASGTMYNDIRVPVNGPRIGKIGISWIDNAGEGVNFNAGLFAVLNFRVISGGNIPVNFMTNCEIADSAGDPININYSNGSLAVPENPVINMQPLPLTLNTTQNGFFSVGASDYDSIQWQINQGSGWGNIQDNQIFQGGKEDTLHVLQPSLALDGASFRCMLSNTCVSIVSDAVMLHVTVLSGNDFEVMNAGIYPNPFIDGITIEISSSAFVEEINLFAADGRLTRKMNVQKQDEHFSIKHLHGLEKGIYYIQIVCSIRMNKRNYTYKLVKN